MQKELLIFLCVSASFEILCLIAQLAYVLYQSITYYQHIELILISVLYFLEISNVCLQHTIYIWTWNCLIIHYMRSLAASRYQVKRPA